jgi:hypothetical protein
MASVHPEAVILAMREIGWKHEIASTPSENSARMAKSSSATLASLACGTMMAVVPLLRVSLVPFVKKKSSIESRSCSVRTQIE